MLCDSIENFAKHDTAFIPALRELAPLFEAVKTRSFEEMKKMELGPFRLCFNEYETRPEAEVPFETHEGNWDLQIMVDGAEYVSWAPAADLSPTQPYDEKEDIAFYTGCGQKILLDYGRAVLLAPWDGHQPGVSISKASSHVKKIVVKIPVGRI